MRRIARCSERAIKDAFYAQNSASAEKEMYYIEKIINEIFNYAIYFQR